MAEFLFRVWLLMPEISVFGDLERGQAGSWLTLMVQRTLSTGIFDGLADSFFSQLESFALPAIGLLVALTVLVQSLVILAFVVDRLFRRFSLESEKRDGHGGTADGQLPRRWLRSLGSRSDD